MRDDRGLSYSNASADAAAAYEAALFSVNSFQGDPISIIDATLTVEPDFIMGHVLRAHVFTTLWEHSTLRNVKKSLAALAPIAHKANAREQAHIAALQAWVRGDWREFQAELESVLVDHPRDLLALQIGHNADFNLGDRAKLRGRIDRVLPDWNDSDPGFGFVRGMYAFGLEENGEYAAAEDQARQALAVQPDDCWGRHSLAHVLEMNGRRTEGIEILQSSQAHWAQPDNNLQGHNWWHLALYYLDEGRTDQVLDLYDAHLKHPHPPFQLNCLDSASLLWRMYLLGLDVGDRWDWIADKYEADEGAGFYAFYDMHAMMAFAATGRFQAAEKRVTRMKETAEQDGDSGKIMRLVGLDTAAGILEFGTGRFDRAVEFLAPTRHRAQALGGSHAQRDVLHRTLVQAALATGQNELVATLGQEREKLVGH